MTTQSTMQLKSALTLAQEVVRVRMKRCVREDLAMGYMWELVMDSKLTKIAVAGIQV